MAEQHDIYLRAHTKLLANNAQEKKKRAQQQEPKWPEYALIFDCESRLTPDQSLTFGFWRFCQLRGEQYVCLEEGIFYAE
jgi:hypothetical protein